MDPRELNLITHYALAVPSGLSIGNFTSPIKAHQRHQLAGSMRHARVFINVHPVTTALFTDKDTAVSNQLQVQQIALS